MNYKFNLDNYLEDLEEIVNIDSFSKNKEGTEKIAKIFKNKYESLGFTTALHYRESSIGPCLVASNCEGEDADILLIGHMDTVFENGTCEERPFEIKDNIAYGPGVVDMKSGLLNMYYAIEEAYYENSIPKIRIFQNSDEEISSLYSRELIERYAKRSKYVLVLEPARKNGALVYERKGLAKYKVSFKGTAAHPGINPEDGRSAINELGHFIVRASELSNLSLGTFVNIGIVEGGIASNVISDRAVCEIDLRFDSDNEIKRIEDTFNKLINSPINKDIKISIEKLSERPPMGLTKENKELINIIENIGNDLNIDVHGVKTGGGSDANITSYLNIPTVDGLGPVGGDAHSEKEYLEIDSIEERKTLLKEVIKYFK